MANGFTMIDGTAAEGADVLRDRLRWAAAERRWHVPASGPCADPLPPSAPGVALRRGAQLSHFALSAVAGSA